MNHNRTIRSVLSVFLALALICVPASGLIFCVSAEANDQLTLKLNGT